MGKNFDVIAGSTQATPSQYTSPLVGEDTANVNDVLTEDHVGNFGPGVRVPNEVRQGEVVSCGAVEMKRPLLVKVAIHGAAPWTTILWRSSHADRE